MSPDAEKDLNQSDHGYSWARRPERENVMANLGSETIEGLTKENIQTLSILRGTFGCTEKNHADVDPYPFAAFWNEAARGDGQSYGGVLETVKRQSGESYQAFYERARERASELDGELHCSRCYRD